MKLRHSLLLAILLIFVLLSDVEGQRRRERLPAPRDPQFYEPRNKLEDFEGRVQTLLVRGRHWIGNIKAQNGSARVEATEIRDSTSAEAASGVVITIVADGGPPGEIRSLIDYDEIDPLIKAMDAAAKAGDNITRLSHFEVRYRTKGDFEIMVFKQLENNVVAAAIEGGSLDAPGLNLSIDDLVKLRWMIAQAKEQLDQAK